MTEYDTLWTGNELQDRPQDAVAFDPEEEQFHFEKNGKVRVMSPEDVLEMLFGD